MTRFARAQGSNYAPERQPLEATSWSDMMKTFTKETPTTHRRSKSSVGTTSSNSQGNENAIIEESSISKDIINDFNVEDVDRFEDIPDVEGQNNGPCDTVELTKEEKLKLKKDKRKEASNRKCLNCHQVGHRKMDCPDLSEERRKELQDLYACKTKDKNVTDTDLTKIKKTKKKKPNKKRFEKVLKDKAGQTVLKDEKLFGGFRVLKEDADNLKKLVAQLKANSTPQVEMDEAIKLERRRAEKRLVRYRKMLCYNCRKPGHTLHDCPSADKLVHEDSDTLHAGHCFKCGSQEHTSKECVTKKKSDSYKFATCFICKESGHLAKSCPDNPRGLYPNGGSCRLCGSVEHLRAYCPRKVEKDERELKTFGKTVQNSDFLEDESLEFGVNVAKKSRKAGEKKVVAPIVVF